MVPVGGLLQGMLKDALGSTWARMLHFDLDHLSVEQRLSLEFAAGGVTALVAYRAHHDPGFTSTDAITATFANTSSRS